MAGCIAAAIIDIGDGERSVESVSGGMFGGLERQAEFADAASKDSDTPTEDGRLTDRRVEVYVGMLRKTQKLRDRLK